MTLNGYVQAKAQAADHRHVMWLSRSSCSLEAASMQPSQTRMPPAVEPVKLSNTRAMGDLVACRAHGARFKPGQRPEAFAWQNTLSEPMIHLFQLHTHHWCFMSRGLPGVEPLAHDMDRRARPALHARGWQQWPKIAGVLGQQFSPFVPYAMGACSLHAHLRFCGSRVCA